jgi:hypothetical protein
MPLRAIAHPLPRSEYARALRFRDTRYMLFKAWFARSHVRERDVDDVKLLVGGIVCVQIGRKRQVALRSEAANDLLDLWRNADHRMKDQ